MDSQELSRIGIDLILDAIDEKDRPNFKDLLNSIEPCEKREEFLDILLEANSFELIKDFIDKMLILPPDQQNQHIELVFSFGSGYINKFSSSVKGDSPEKILLTPDKSIEEGREEKPEEMAKTALMAEIAKSPLLRSPALSHREESDHEEQESPKSLDEEDVFDKAIAELIKIDAASKNLRQRLNEMSETPVNNIDEQPSAWLAIIDQVESMRKSFNKTGSRNNQDGSHGK